MERKPAGLGVAERFNPAGENGAPVDIDAWAAQLRGRTPDEVLADTGHASLGKSLAVATAGCVVLLGVLTVVPFLMGSGPHKPKPAESAAAAPAKPAAPEEPATKENAPKPDASKGSPQTASPEAMKKLGIDDVKQSDPKKNPLDGADDLLKDLK